MLGVCEAMDAMTIIRRGHTHVAGASAGALVAASYGAGMPFDAVSSVHFFESPCRMSLDWGNSTNSTLSASLHLM